MKTEMKKIFYYIGIIALGLAAASCDDYNSAPVFDDDNAFVELGKTSVMVSEDGGTISIPVTLASVAGIADNVSYGAVDGTAKEGVDFELVDGSAMLKFDAQNRTQYIQVKIIERPGEYTGDLRFSIELKSAGTVDLGMNKVCTISITDNDHPLASILGSYTATSLNYGSAAQTWSLNISKDPDDVTVVHIDAITPGCIDYASWGDWSYTGQVSEDLNTITLGAGQTCEAWYTTETDVFKIYTWIDGIYLDDTEDIIFTQTAPGVWECSQNIWLRPVEDGSLYTNWCDRAPIVLTKN